MLIRKKRQITPFGSKYYFRAIEDDDFGGSSFSLVLCLVTMTDKTKKP